MAPTKGSEVEVMQRLPPSLSSCPALLCWRGLEAFPMCAPLFIFHGRVHRVHGGKVSLGEKKKSFPVVRGLWPESVPGSTSCPYGRGPLCIPSAFLSG